MKPPSLQTKSGEEIEISLSNKGVPVRLPWSMLHFVAMVNDHEVGYLTVSYVCREDFEAYLPHVWHFACKICGWVRLEEALGIEGLTQFFLPKDRLTLRTNAGLAPEDRDKLWHKVAIGHRYWGTELDDVPEPKQRERDLELWSRDLKKDFARFEASHVDRPVVDYIRTYPEYQRKGIATALYQHVAYWLCEHRGLALHASGLQKPEAALAWEKMRKDPSIPTMETPAIPEVKLRARTRIDYRLSVE